jgi:hypothetical protein
VGGRSQGSLQGRSQPDPLGGTEAVGLNYFDSHDAAQSYSAARPYFHPLVIEKVKDFIGIDKLVPRALDVACGTGQVHRGPQGDRRVDRRG